MLVTASRTERNLILTVGPNQTANDLLNCKEIWAPILEPVQIYKDAHWTRIIAHGINLQSFDNNTGLSLIRQEIQTFNGLKLAREPLWLTRPEYRMGKTRSSVILTVFTENDAKKAIHEGLIIGGEKAIIKAFQEQKSTDQCFKCQKPGHFERYCKSTPKCQYDGQEHLTNNHNYYICQKKGQAYIHTKIQCANCLGPYRANNPICEVLRAVQPKSH